MDISTPLKNGLLSQLDASDLMRLKPHLRRVALPKRKALESRNRKVAAIYFPESGIASTVVSGGHANEAEAGLIGHESITGLAAVMGIERAPFDVFMQIAGEGWCIATGDLLPVLEERASLRRLFLRHAYLFRVQTSYTALANARYNLEERLARWLLMAQDRMETPDLDLTQEFLALMLGVRRPSVTVAMKLLEKSRLIRVRRGGVSILDREGLEEAANGSYGAPEAEYRRLFG